MLLTDVGNQMCWWQVRDISDRFRMLMTDLIHRESHQHSEKNRQDNDSAANIRNQSPTSLSQWLSPHQSTSMLMTESVRWMLETNCVNDTFSVVPVNANPETESDFIIGQIFVPCFQSKHFRFRFRNILQFSLSSNCHFERIFRKIWFRTLEHLNGTLDVMLLILRSRFCRFG